MTVNGAKKTHLPSVLLLKNSHISHTVPFLQQTTAAVKQTGVDGSQKRTTNLFSILKKLVDLSDYKTHLLPLFEVKDIMFVCIHPTITVMFLSSRRNLAADGKRSSLAPMSPVNTECRTEQLVSNAKSLSSMS